MAKRYLQLDWKSSRLFEYSKNQQEGFEAHTNSEGTTSYRRYQNESLVGVLKNVGVRDSQIGQQLNIALDCGEDLVICQFALYDSKGNVENCYAESIISKLGNLEKGKEYAIFPYNLTADKQREYDETTEGREVRDKYYDKRAVSIKENGEKVMTYLTYKEGTDLSIPRVVWKEDRFNQGKKKPTPQSLALKNEFLLNELARCIDGHLAYEGNNNTTPVQTKQIEVIQPELVTEEEEDHLPF